MTPASRETQPSRKQRKAKHGEGERRGQQPQPAAGHLEPGHAARLLRLSHETDVTDADVGFVTGHHSSDDLTERLGEAAVSAMTSGEGQLADDWDGHVEEEDGGPFVESLADAEFAKGTDESNIAGASREPFPRTSNAR